MSTTTLNSSTQNTSNEPFLKWAFGRDNYLRAHICSFPDDPENPSSGSIWQGGPADKWLAHMDPENNNYYSVSLFANHDRQKESFTSLVILGVDDVGTKVDPDVAERLLGEPSYKIE